jgi:RES domain-containing protein
MVVYRITNCDYALDLNGTGARLFGGRWNSEGKPVIYTASSCSLAVLEVLVHLPPLMIPDNYCLVEIEVPNSVIKTIEIDELPADWKDISPPARLRQIGDEFLNKREYLLMKVPSSIVPMEYNYLINPQHKDMRKVKVSTHQPFDFDERLA